MFRQVLNSFAIYEKLDVILKRARAQGVYTEEQDQEGEGSLRQIGGPRGFPGEIRR